MGTTRSVKYWLKESDTTFVPLASANIGELNFYLNAYDAEWCPGCKVGVYPEGVLNVQGMKNVCPFCGTDTTPVYDPPLTEAQHRAMILFRRGGGSAWCQNQRGVSQRTIDSLMRRDYLGTNGATAKGARYCQDAA